MCLPVAYCYPVLRYAPQLASALEWLFEHRPAAPPLKAARLRHLAQDFIGRQVTRRLYSDLRSRNNRRRVEQVRRCEVV